MQVFLLAWLVLDLTDSPLRVALVGFSAMAPMLLLGVFGGVLADRLDRRGLMLTTQSINFAMALAMTSLLLTGAVQFWHAYLFALVMGSNAALDSPSRRSAIHDLLGRSGVTNAMALDSVGVQSSKMLGPALAGLLIMWVDVVGGYVVVSAFYLIAVTLLKTFTLPPSLAPKSAARMESRTSEGRHLPGVPEIRRELVSAVRNLVEGFRYVRGERTIMAALLVTFFMNLLLFPYNDVVLVIAKNLLT